MSKGKKFKKLTPALKRDIIRLYKAGGDVKSIREHCMTKMPKITTDRVATVLHSHYEGVADDVWAIKVKEKEDSKCAVCKQGDKQLNAHHLIGRKNSNYRYDLDNGIALCCEHHTLGNSISAHGSTDVTDRFMDWLKGQRPEQWEWFIENRDNSSARPYKFWELEAICNELQEIEL